MSVALRIALLAIVLALTSCVSTSLNTTFYPSGAFQGFRFDPKSRPEEVRLLREIPKGGFAILGELALAGGPNTTFQQMLDAAMQRAAERGADFIVLIGQNVQTHAVSMPGISTTFGSVDATASATNSGALGTASGYSTTLSIPPSVRMIRTPTMNVLVGRYPKVWLGFNVDLKRTDGRAFITEFAWNSDAPKAGLKVGDEWLAINNCDVKSMSEEILGDFFFGRKPAGTKWTLVVRRGEELLQFDVAQVPRF